MKKNKSFLSQKLDQRIHDAKERNKKIYKEKDTSDSEIHFSSLAWRASVDMISGIVVGCFLGYLLDKQLNAAPWLLLLGFLLGAAGGFLNVLRTLKKNGLFFLGKQGTTQTKDEG